MKYRVIESDNNKFYPQCKPGLFKAWKFYSKRAEENIDAGWLFQILIFSSDPASAICFDTVDEAYRFFERLDEKIQLYWKSYEAKRIRISQGIDVKKIYKINW